MGSCMPVIYIAKVHVCALYTQTYVLKIALYIVYLIMYNIISLIIILYSASCNNYIIIYMFVYLSHVCTWKI